MDKLKLYDFRAIFILNLRHFRTKASEFSGHFRTFQNKKIKNVISCKPFPEINININEKKLTEVYRGKNINYKLAQTKPCA